MPESTEGQLRLREPARPEAAELAPLLTSLRRKYGATGPYAFAPMNSRERRMVHLALRDAPLCIRKAKAKAGNGTWSSTEDRAPMHDDYSGGCSSFSHAGSRRAPAPRRISEPVEFPLEAHVHPTILAEFPCFRGSTIGTRGACPAMLPTAPFPRWRAHFSPATARDALCHFAAVKYAWS